MIKNVVIALLLILVIGEGIYLVKEKAQVRSAQAMAENYEKSAARPSPTSNKARPKPMFVMKGQKFADNPLFPKAYLIFPSSGDLSTDAQKALTGWDVKTTANSDGSTQVDLIPKEAEDIKQSFTVRTGSKLYFIELTLADDQTGVDENRGDDIGVLVDANGLVQ